MHFRQFRLTLLLSTILLSCSAYVIRQACPNVEIKGDSDAIVYGFEAELSATVPPEFLVDGVKYDWTVTEGLVFSGQGSKSIVFKADREQSGREFSIRVTVSGLKSPCQAVAETKIRVVNSIDYFPIDEFTVYSDEVLRARVANFFIHINKSTDLVALIEMQFKSNLTYKERVRRIESILKTLKLQKQNIDRVYFLISSEHESTFTRFWLWPEGRISKSPGGRGIVVSGKNIEQELPSILKSN